ncbi:MAG: hypothetical protein HDS86_06090 [Bacteroidales bacterium]|nr:hypothetical protein [Bacteroidales bacterium]
MIEKVIGCFKGLFLLCALALIPAACSQGAADEPEPVVPETPNEGNEVLDSDSVMVSFAPTSLEWEVSPMSRASNDDLYAVVVYQSNSEITKHSNEVQTALALFDDPTLISLKLAKNQYYHFVMTYVPNGKNVIEKVGDKWGAPFILTKEPELTPELNTVVYKNVNYSNIGFVAASSQAKGVTESLDGYNTINEVLRYMGSYRNFKPTENNQKIPIELYRWQYGVKINVTDFKEGEIIYKSIMDRDSRFLTLQGNASGSATMEYLLEYPIDTNIFCMFEYENAGEFAENYKFVDYMTIIYNTPKDEEITLWSNWGQRFPFKRMKMHTLEFSLSDAIVNGGISPDLMEAATDPMEEVSWEF